MNILEKCQFLIIILIFGFTNQFELYIGFITFALIHELGHLLMGVLLGKKIEKVQILPLGVNISFKILVEDYNKKIIKGNISNIKNLLIAIAGPFVNFVIAIILYNLRSINLSEIKLFRGISLEIIIYINLLIGFFNLIPIYPLDGGQIVKEILCITLGKKSALKHTNIISNISIIMLTILSSIVIIIVKNIAIFLIICFLWGLVIKENKRYNMIKKMYEMVESFERVDRYNYFDI